MPDRSIIIIGAGIAGLSAGCYARMNGYRTRILEMHNLPGGLCTSWRRDGYLFDGCIHWLIGTNPNSGFYHIWEELGALRGTRIVDHDEFTRIEGPGGRYFVVHSDIGLLEQHLRAISPADFRPIGELAAALRRFTRFNMLPEKPRELYGLLDGMKMGIKMLPFLRPLQKWSRTSTHEFAAHFKDPFLREVFPRLVDLPDFPMLAVILALSCFHGRNAGYPIGGSLEFAARIARRYRDLGGEIEYNARVTKILVEGDRAVGVRLEDGAQHRAETIISAADGHATIFDMLDGRYVSDDIRGYYAKLPIFKPVIQVSLGVARDLRNHPYSVNYLLERPIMIAGQEHRRMAMRHCCFDPDMAPAGKSVVLVLFNTDYGYWRSLYDSRERYNAEKTRVADAVIGELERRLPGIARQIEVVDVATPVTTERYTGNWQGSIEGWLITTETMRLAMGKGMSKTLPGLANMYMIGQWVEPGGGLPPAAMSGRQVIQLICRRDRQPFSTSVP